MLYMMQKHRLQGAAAPAQGRHPGAGGAVLLQRGVCGVGWGGGWGGAPALPRGLQVRQDGRQLVQQHVGARLHATQHLRAESVRGRTQLVGAGLVVGAAEAAWVPHGRSMATVGRPAHHHLHEL